MAGVAVNVKNRLLSDYVKFNRTNIFSNLIAVNFVRSVHFICNEQIPIGLENRTDLHDHVHCFPHIRQFGGT